MKRAISILVAAALIVPILLAPGIARAADATGEICKVKVGEINSSLRTRIKNISVM